jgi:hypothetical protein
MTYIVQRKDRFYVIAYDGIDPLTGKERRRWHSVGHDRAEAEAIALRLAKDRFGAPAPKGGPITLGEFMTGTWLPQKRRHVRATTAYRYSWFVDRYVNPAIGDVPLRRLRADRLDSLYEQLAATGGRHGTGLAAKTILEVHMVVRAALDLAVERELVARNIAHHARARRRPPARPAARVWNAEELRAFLASARHHRLYPILHLAAHTGCVAASSSVSSGATSTARGRGCRSREPCRTSVADRSSSASRRAPVAAPSTSTTRRWTSSIIGIGGSSTKGSPTGPTTGCSATLPVGSSTPSRSASSSSAACAAPSCRAFGFTIWGTPTRRCSSRPARPSRSCASGSATLTPAFTMHTYQHLLPGMSAAAAEQFAALVAA